MKNINMNEDENGWKYYEYNDTNPYYDKSMIKIS